MTRIRQPHVYGMGNPQGDGTVIRPERRRSPGRAVAVFTGAGILAWLGLVFWSWL